MALIGYHVSHEQFKPSTLLQYVQLAEKAGFQAALSSDHFHPWTNKQGESGFAWAWLGAAMQATNLTFGVVNAPGQRYHPAIIAQAAATLGEMFPKRFWMAQGSGQALNEMITGDKWPAKADRNKRLKESVDVIRALWDGETITHKGLINVEEATLYTRPEVKPLIIGAAITEQTAEWVGSWADGMITISRPADELKKVIAAFKRGGGEGKPMFLKVQLSYADTEEKARQGAFEQWRANIFDSKLLSDLRVPEQFEAAGQFVNPNELDNFVRISSDVQRHIDWLTQDIKLGFDHLYLHNVNLEHEQFIQTFGEKVLPALASK
ncbi:MAG: LLM class F420-dependent oxidoreductase [Cytophagales bacterium CG18_big_fil_WC_8_21_14_2_50_42_9]|nr:MAG: LLM class F420-dependent oxidoreductase [Cytophagales bacterium CG18_big_fil_WC_8_21_14_2_50_42_9]